MANRIVSLLSIGALAVLIGISAIACSTNTQAAEQPAQPAVSAPAAPIAPAVAPLAQQVSAKSTQIERPPMPNFKGRPAPSAAFPLSDAEYVAAGKRILQERSDLPKVMNMWRSLGNPSRANITPLGVEERCSDGINFLCYIAVGYQIETDEGRKGVLVNVNLRQGTAFELVGIHNFGKW